MTLETYRRKRDFTATGEPRGSDRRGTSDAFVVQKHAARRLHYDLRLEIGDVLASWAVTRGPSLVPEEKRLAVRVEDHPLDYADFEGEIARGQYGAGAVIVWDRGRWQPEGDPRRGLEEGRLDFTLDGAKLRGRWHLVRMAPKPGETRENWLLIKGEDAAARTAADPDILEEAPESVLSGRSVEEVAAGDGRPKAPKKPPASDRPKPRRGGTDAKPRLRLTHPDRVYWPDAGVTKQDLADHYAAVWPRMAPLVVNRPVALLRCPAGTGGQCFFQKHAWKGLSRAIPTFDDPEDDGGEPLIAVDSLPAVIGLVQGGALEIHTWQSSLSDLEHPDQLVVDLDPGEGIEWPGIVAAAREVRTRLEAAGLAAFVKTTGGKGLHVVAPLAPAAGWDAVKDFTGDLARAMAADAPDRYVATVAKAKRTGRILIDYLRNGRNNTAVAPYATRARPGAPVSMPVAWDELGPGIGPAHFTVANTPARLADSADPWAGFRDAARPLA